MQRIAPPPPPTPNITRLPAQLPTTKPRATPPMRPPPISDHIIQVYLIAHMKKYYVRQK